MIKSIQKFHTTGVEKIFVNYANDMKKIAEMVIGVKDIVINLGLSMIAEEWGHYDELLREGKDLRSQWYIVRKEETILITSVGAVTYRKILFKIDLQGNQSIC